MAIASFTEYCKSAYQIRIANQSISYKKISFFYWLHLFPPPPSPTSTPP